MTELTREDEALHPARHWHQLADGRVQCDVCPRDCQLQEGQRAFCFVRRNVGGRLVLTTWGRSSGFCVDPIEKKPLNHFFPGSSVLSFGTAGCNLGCKFCQNWDISKSRQTDRVAELATPEAIAQSAVRLGCRSVAFTYNDPTIFLEYATDVADACHAHDLMTVAVTAGYMHDAARRDMYAHIDAANVDLKSFRDDFYLTLTGAHLGPVLETLEYLVHETSVWVEITTLLIPGHNDSDAEIAELCEWVVTRLGADVPLHFTAFHPDYRMAEVAPTPLETIRRARQRAVASGLHHVYSGNVHDVEGDTTRCRACGAAVVVRDRYEILRYELDASGCCRSCGRAAAGRWSSKAEAFGRRRIPIHI